MKKFNLNTSNNRFTVDKNQINNSNALLPYILFKKMELYTLEATNNYHEYINSKPQLMKLNILKNAFLNDQLQIDSHIKKLNRTELQLTVNVVKEFEDSKDIVCKALFKFSLNGIKIKQVS